MSNFNQVKGHKLHDLKQNQVVWICALKYGNSKGRVANTLIKRLPPISARVVFQEGAYWPSSVIDINGNAHKIDAVSIHYTVRSANKMWDSIVEKYVTEIDNTIKSLEKRKKQILMTCVKDDE